MSISKPFARARAVDSTSRRSPLRRGALTAGLLLALSGCDPVVEIPTTAEVRADAPPGAAGTRVRFISASEFQATDDSPPSVTLIRADTVELTVPFTRDVEIRSHAGQRKLYLELGSIEPGTLPVRMRVVIQDQSWYDLTLDLLEFRHRFVYARN